MGRVLSPEELKKALASPSPVPAAQGGRVLSAEEMKLMQNPAYQAQGDYLGGGSYTPSREGVRDFARGTAELGTGALMEAATIGATPWAAVAAQPAIAAGSYYAGNLADIGMSELLGIPSTVPPTFGEQAQQATEAAVIGTAMGGPPSYYGAKVAQEIPQAYQSAADMLAGRQTALAERVGVPQIGAGTRPIVKNPLFKIGVGPEELNVLGPIGRMVVQNPKLEKVARWVGEAPEKFLIDNFSDAARDPATQQYWRDQYRMQVTEAAGGKEMRYVAPQVQNALEALAANRVTHVASSGGADKQAAANLNSTLKRIRLDIFGPETIMKGKPSQVFEVQVKDRKFLIEKASTGETIVRPSNGEYSWAKTGTNKLALRPQDTPGEVANIVAQALGSKEGKVIAEYGTGTTSVKNLQDLSFQLRSIPGFRNMTEDQKGAWTLLRDSIETDISQIGDDVARAYAEGNAFAVESRAVKELRKVFGGSMENLGDSGKQVFYPDKFIKLLDGRIKDIKNVLTPEQLDNLMQFRDDMQTVASDVAAYANLEKNKNTFADIGKGVSIGGLTLIPGSRGFVVPYVGFDLALSHFLTTQPGALRKGLGKPVQALGAGVKKSLPGIPPALAAEQARD